MKKVFILKQIMGEANNYGFNRNHWLKFAPNQNKYYEWLIETGKYKSILLGKTFLYAYSIYLELEKNIILEKKDIVDAIESSDDPLIQFFKQHADPISPERVEEIKKEKKAKKEKDTK